MAHSLNIVYFAWVRERLGRSEEQADIAETIVSVQDLLSHLSQLDTAFADVMTEQEKLRFALDQEFVKPDAKLDHAKELAIFPPVTGG